MFRFFRCVFNTKEIIVGDIYSLHNDEPGNPFHQRIEYEVLAVKNGYVLYRYKDSETLCQSESMDILSFKYSYDRVSNQYTKGENGNQRE